MDSTCFTGIVRDLTEEVKKERMRQAEEDCLPPDLEGFRRWAGRDDQQALWPTRELLRQ
jgi:hypothetical protein